jgi:hypothetical protein
MPLTNKGEKIKGAMEEKYGAEKGEKVFYASKNKGTISGVDAMSYRDSLHQLASKADALATRWDAFMKRRADAFEEAQHPRNAGGVFATGEGEEGKEKGDSTDREELRTGGLSKRT